MKCYEPGSFLRKILPLLLLGLLLVLYTQLLLTYMIPVTGGTDQNGYHICAKMLARDGTFYQKTEDDLQFVGSMWVVNERGEYYPKYPPIYPAMIAGLNALLGDGGGFYATLWGAILSVAGIFVFARFWMNRYWALLPAFFLALSPVVATLGITKNSHTPSLALLIWGMTAFLYAASKRKPGFLIFAVFGGFLIGATVGIRYTDFLMILVPAAYGLFLIRGKRKWLLLLALGLGAAIPYAWMGYFHWTAYGAPWRSGYSLTSESSAFEPRFIWTNIQIYLPEFFTMSVGPLAILALLIWRWRWRRACFWAAWILPTFALYLTYYWAPENSGTGTMRFLVPLIPPVLLLTALSLRKLQGILRNPWLFTGSLTLLLVLQTLWGWTEITRLCEPKYVSDLQKQIMVDFACSRIPSGSVLLANTGFLNELDYEKRWTLYGSYLMNPREIERMVRRSLDAQAAGLQQDRAKKLQEKLGRMNYGSLYAFLRTFLEQKQKEGKAVYFLGRPGEANHFRRVFYRFFEIEKIGVVTGFRDPWLLRRLKPDASRYSAGQLKQIELPAIEIIKLGPKRAKYLPTLDSEPTLQAERNEIILRLNPERTGVIADDLYRLESIRDEITQLRRNAAEEKRQAELRKRRAIQQRRAQLEKEKQRKAQLEKEKLRKTKKQKKN